MEKGIGMVKEQYIIRMEIDFRENMLMAKLKEGSSFLKMVI